MACLGDRGAMFAVESTNSLPSKIEYRSFDSWGSNSDWVFLCSPLENVKGMFVTGIVTIYSTHLPKSLFC